MHIVFGTRTDTDQLPVTVSAPQYLEQKATINAMFALGNNPQKAADGIEEHINKKRQELGI